MAEKKLIFLGPPDSGKTTYIACLWDYVNSEKSDKKIELENFKDTEDEYLEKIKTEWIQCKKVPRTYMANRTENVTMKVVKAASNEKFFLEVPDLSGELFDSFFRNRAWRKDFDDLFTAASGILLFVDPTGNNNRSQFISDATLMKAALKGTGKEPVKSEGAATEKKFVMKNPKQWMHDLSSTQVKLVDVLQFIEERNNSGYPIKISIVVSRWDIVQKLDPNLEPAEWFRINLPLTDQFLSANSKLFNSKIFGVSAQGCNYEDEPERQQALKLETYNRPIVQEGKHRASDISSPILWLLGNEN